MAFHVVHGIVWKFHCSVFVALFCAKDWESSIVLQKFKVVHTPKSMSLQ